MLTARMAPFVIHPTPAERMRLSSSHNLPTSVVELGSADVRGAHTRNDNNRIHSKSDRTRRTCASRTHRPRSRARSAPGHLGNRPFLLEDDSKLDGFRSRWVTTFMMRCWIVSETEETVVALASSSARALKASPRAKSIEMTDTSAWLPWTVRSGRLLGATHPLSPQFVPPARSEMFAGRSTSNRGVLLASRRGCVESVVEPRECYRSLGSQERLPRATVESRRIPCKSTSHSSEIPLGDAIPCGQTNPLKNLDKSPGILNL